MVYQPFDLSGKNVLITGGNRGIGLGMARALAESGASVIIWGTNKERNAEAAKELGHVSDGGQVLHNQVNVAVEEEVMAGMQDAVEQLGQIDSVFANAGIGRASRSFVDMPYEQYREVLAVNLDGAFFTLREGARHMVDRAEQGNPGGSLVGVASLAAIEGAAANQHYSATKGGLISMIKGIAVEHARYGVRANAILPGWIATDMTEMAQNSDAFARKVIPRVPIRRWGEPADFGGVAVYLASDASAYHSGGTLVVDGGYSIF